MGWTYGFRARGMSNAQWFGRELNHGDRYVRDVASKFDASYIAFNTPRGVIGVVAQTQWIRTSPGDFSENFGVKYVEETSGPLHHECPERILRQLTPVQMLYSDEHSRRSAQEWRDACWQTINDRKARPTVRQGDVVRFASPIEFVDGFKGDVFVYTGTGSRFHAVVGLDDGHPMQDFRTYQISNWRKRPYTPLPDVNLTVR